MIEIKEDFHIRLEKAMALRGKKAIDVVNATGISHSAFSQYRSGHTKPKRNNLIEIANYLNVNPSWLMGLDVPMTLDGENPIQQNILMEYCRQMSKNPDAFFSYPDGKAMEFMQLYTSATPEIQAAVLTLLKSAKPSPESPNQHQ